MLKLVWGIVLFIYFDIIWNKIDINIGKILVNKVYLNIIVIVNSFNYCKSNNILKLFFYMGNFNLVDWDKI